jgi:hypothetical protein
MGKGLLVDRSRVQDASAERKEFISPRGSKRTGRQRLPPGKQGTARTRHYLSPWCSTESTGGRGNSPPADLEPTAMRVPWSGAPGSTHLANYGSYAPG